VDVRVPGGSMLEVVPETPGVVVADVPMVVTMLGRGVGVLGFFALAFGALPDIGHWGASFRLDDSITNPARRVPCNRPSGWRALIIDVW
jgi:hypothetical protein